MAEQASEKPKGSHLDGLSNFTKEVVIAKETPW